MRNVEDFDFISNLSSKFRNIEGKFIDRMLSAGYEPIFYVDENQRLNHSDPQGKKETWFSYVPRLFYMEIRDFGVLVFSSRGRQHQSVGAAYLHDMPSHAEIEEQLYYGRPVIQIEADDPVYSRPYFAGFLGRRITKVEAILGLRDGLPTPRRNERGLRITDDRDRQLLVGWGIFREDIGIGMCVITPEEAKKSTDDLTYKEM